MPIRFAMFALVVLSGIGTVGATPIHPAVVRQANGAPRAPVSWPSPPAHALPRVVQTGNPHPYWRQLGLSAQSTWGITAGSDGNEWVGDRSGEDLIRIAMDGTTTEFKTTNFEPYYMKTGSDGRIWMTGVEATQDVAAMTTDGVFTAYQSPSGDHSLGGSGLAVGRDQNVWFAESSHIASVTPGGTVTEYLYPSGQTDNTYPAVTLGSDGRIWFTELNGILGAINTSSHRIAEYRLNASSCGLIYGLAAGGDGNLYAPCQGHAYRISTQGKILRHYNLPGELGTATSSTMEAPDGRVWISLYHEFGVIDVYSRGGEIVRVPSPFNQSFTSMAAGPDANMWGMGDETVNIYLRSRLDVRPLHLTLNPNATAVLRASYRGQLTLSATSANPNVATVAPAKTLDDFVVTAVAKGKTTVTVQDPIGNSFVVPVTVR